MLHVDSDTHGSDPEIFATLSSIQSQTGIIVTSIALDLLVDQIFNSVQFYSP